MASRKVCAVAAEPQDKCTNPQAFAGHASSKSCVLSQILKEGTLAGGNDENKCIPTELSVMCTARDPALVSQGAWVASSRQVLDGDSRESPLYESYSSFNLARFGEFNMPLRWLEFWLFLLLLRKVDLGKSDCFKNKNQSNIYIVTISRY